MINLMRIDVRLSDKAILSELKDKQPISQSDLADVLQCHEETVRRAIKRLVKLGHIEPLTAGRRKPREYLIHDAS